MIVNISIKNTSTDFQADLITLKDVVNAVKKIYPQEEVVVTLEISPAMKFQVDIETGHLDTAEPMDVFIGPRYSRVEKTMVSMNFAEETQNIAEKVKNFLFGSDTYRGSLKIEVSSGFNAHTFLTSI